MMPLLSPQPLTGDLANSVFALTDTGQKIALCMYSVCAELLSLDWYNQIAEMR